MRAPKVTFCDPPPLWLGYGKVKATQTTWLGFHHLKEQTMTVRRQDA